MKIWYLITKFPSANADEIDTYVDAASLQMVRAGHEVAVITLDSADENQVDAYGRHVIRFTATSKCELELLTPEAKLSLQFRDVVLRTIRDLTFPDIIDVLDSGAISYYLIQAKYLGVKEIQHSKIIVTQAVPMDTSDQDEDMNIFSSEILRLQQMKRYCMFGADAFVNPSECSYNLPQQSHDDFSVPPNSVKNEEKEDSCQARQLENLVNRKDCKKERKPVCLKDICREKNELENFYKGVCGEIELRNEYPFINLEPRTSLPEGIDAGRKGLLSIIIPFYNLGSTLQNTVKSALASDYLPREIIIINDGTNEKKSLQVLNLIRNSYPEIRILDIPNGGLAHARNVGAESARGEFISFLDADDLVATDYYSRCIGVLQRYENVSYVYSWLQYFDESQNIWTTFDTDLPSLLIDNQLAAFAVARKVDFLAFGKNDPTMKYSLEDYDGWLSMAENGRMGVCIPEPLCQYRIRSDSMLRRQSRVEEELMRQKIMRKHAKLYQKYAVELLSLSMNEQDELRDTLISERRRWAAWQNTHLSRLQMKYYTLAGKIKRSLKGEKS